MFSRKSKLKRRAQAIADKAADGGVREQLDELGDALEDARDAIARASASAGRKVAGVTAETARQAAEATREAAEATRGAARQAAESTRRASGRQAKAARAAAERLGESDLGDLSKKAAVRLFRERAKARRKERRKHRRRMVYRGAGVAGVGVLVGWLTAPKRGREARQALKQQAAKASEKGWEKVAEGRESGPEQQSAEVHSLHDATGTGGQPRTPKD